MPLTSAIEFKQYAGVSGSGDDALIAALLAAAEARIEKLLGGRKLAASDYTFRLDGSGSSALVLPQYPINEVVRVSIDLRWQFASSSDVDLSNIDSDPDTGILYIDGVWPEGTRNILVECNCGFEQVPADVQHAANMLLADWYTRAKQLAGGQPQNELTTERIGDRDETYASEMSNWGVPVPVKMILDTYRRW